MVVFALSCFGLLLFLWLSFGGPVPLKPKGYRVQIDFPEATTLATEADVRVAGVPVGKVRKVEVGDGTNRTRRDRRARAPLRAAAQRRARRPAPEDAARRDLRGAHARAARRRRSPRAASCRTARSSRPSSSTRSSTRWTRRRARRSRAGRPSWPRASRAAGATSTTRSARCPASPPTAPTCSPCSTPRRARCSGSSRTPAWCSAALTAERGAAAQPDHGLQAHVRRDRVQERRAGRDDPDLPDLPAGVQAHARARAEVLDRHRPADHGPAPGRARPAADAARRARAGAGPRALLPRTSTR